MSLSRVWNSVVNPQNNEKTRAANGIGQNLAGLFDATNMGIIFGLLLAGAAISPILFLIAMGATLLKAGMAWRAAWQAGFYDRKMYKAARERGRWVPGAFFESMSHSLVNALKETLFAAMVSVAVIGAIFIPGGFLLATPILFTAFCGLNLLFNAGTSAYYAGKTAQEIEMQTLSADGKETNTAAKANQKKKGNSSLVKPAPAKAPSMNAKLRNMHAIGTVLTVLFLASVVTLFLFPPLGLALSATAATVMAGIGLTAATAAIGLGIYGIIESTKAVKTAKQAESDSKLEDEWNVVNTKKNSNGRSSSTQKSANAFNISGKNQSNRKGKDDENNLLDGNSPTSEKNGSANQPILIPESTKYTNNQRFLSGKSNYQPLQSKSFSYFGRPGLAKSKED